VIRGDQKSGGPATADTPTLGSDPLACAHSDSYSSHRHNGNDSAPLGLPRDPSRPLAAWGPPCSLSRFGEGAVRHHLRCCLGGLYVLPYLRGVQRAAARDSATLSARSRYPSGCDEVGRMRYRTEPSVLRLIARCPVLPRPSVHRTSPGCLSWLYKSPAAPDLHLMIPELPAHHGVVLWRARFTNSHSSLKLVLLCHTRDITPLLDISSARYPKLPYPP
jgi:hypothetical protein